MLDWLCCHLSVLVYVVIYGCWDSHILKYTSRCFSVDSRCIQVNVFITIHLYSPSPLYYWSCFFDCYRFTLPVLVLTSRIVCEVLSSTLLIGIISILCWCVLLDLCLGMF